MHIKTNISRKKKLFIIWIMICILVPYFIKCIYINFIVPTMITFCRFIYRPKPPEKIKCVQYKDLCIADSDVEFESYIIKSYDPHLKVDTYNSWETAQNACKAWGGRLPHLEEFKTISDADQEFKIRIKGGEYYYSDTLLNPNKDNPVIIFYLAFDPEDQTIDVSFKRAFTRTSPRARCVKD